ncbi:HlyD family efflux transporter periplasmic adaptor subunit [Methylobacterium sp. Leaf108]|uniref:HlyD family efflux transporter periplasmic adaptor subunit n=1 Tax=Methylobacterium sp. Leaf108 TaxID=1736256 RepID=UPI0006F90A16|nr:HlyD family efflux transporter periplasmic adaptor subunit [Methylobacterium sp. Leaf108]KQP59713.1 hypothetical protein ASF39_16305 [Methylobacterium sp. Leaf108]
MKRTIAAILAADVAGYSRLIAQDEEDTLRRLADHTALYRGQVSEFGGRVFNTAGDAILAEFPSAVEALRAAIAIQRELGRRNDALPPERRLAFRMGLTIGDVVAVEGDLLGDGVNVAARLEGIAEPGGICLSASVHETVSNKVPVQFRDIGPQRLKNIPRPVHAYRVVWPQEAAAAGSVRDRLRRSAPARRWLLVPALAVPAALALALRAGPLPWRDDPADPPGDPVVTEALPVSVIAARHLCFKDEVRLGGVVVPRREIEVRPEGEGLRVLTVAVEPLARVAAGQVLATLGRLHGPEQPPVTLRAPASGVVGRVSATPGAPVTAAGPAPFQIVAQGEFELAAEVPLSDLGRIAAGQPATVTPLGLPESRGRVRTVSASAEGASQSGRVRIQMAEAGEPRQGTFARAVVTVEERCGTAIPASAVMIGEEGRFVYRVEDGRIEPRLVTIGLSAGGDVEVRGGLERNDVVVARAGAFLREGAAIRPIRVEAGRAAD